MEEERREEDAPEETGGEKETGDEGPKEAGPTETRAIGLDLATTSKDVIALFLDEADSHSVFEDVLKANASRPEILKILYDNPETPEHVLVEVGRLLRMPVKASTEMTQAEKKELQRKRDERREAKAMNLTQRVQRLTVSERIQLAMRGGKEARGLLIRDSNKQVVLAVMDNPKLTETEVEAVARSRSVIEEALRLIARNREWMKNYSILYAIATNPRTPAGIAISFVSSLKKKDLALLEKNRNVAEVIRAAAKRLSKGRRE